MSVQLISCNYQPITKIILFFVLDLRIGDGEMSDPDSLC